MASAAVLAAGAAFIPGSAQAAAPTQSAAGAHGVVVPAPTGTGSAAFKTFTSPADKSYRVQQPATAGPVHSRAATTGRTIFAITETCTTDTGTGSQAAPFCDLQDAVNAAAPGDTILVSATLNSNLQSSYSTESVTVKTSGISIVGTTNNPQICACGSLTGKPALVLDGVTNVTVSHLLIQSGSPSWAVQVVGSSQITLDSDHIRTTNANGISIDGTSSGVAVTRSYLNAGYQGGAYTAVAVASGASNITVAGDLIAGAGITATDVKGLNVAGNTVQRGCHSAVDIEGASSAVAIENNLLEDGNPVYVTNYFDGAVPGTCTSAGLSWAPDVTVAAGSAPATTADYNDIYIDGSNATAPYSWAGTAYPTLAAFQAAQPQAAHDTLETVKPWGVGNGQEFNVDYALQPGAAAINSANLNAPGALSSDFFGSGPVTDRGAVEYHSTNPGMALALTAKNTSAYGVSLNVNVTTKNVQQWLAVNWGDGTQGYLQQFPGNPGNPTLLHTYAKLGTYPVTVTDNDVNGNTVVNNVQVSTVGADYTAYGPTRLLDTRNGIGAAQAQVPAYGTARVKIAGNGTIPAGVTAAVLNVTVTDTAAGGHITAYGEGGSAPSTSNVNYSAGQTVPNLVTVPVGGDGYVDLYNGGWGAVDLIADITGYFTQSASSGYQAMGATRLIDTRYGTGTAQGQVPAYGSFPVQIANAAPGLPNGGITAVALNVTVTNPKSDGHLTVYPDGAQPPTTSNVNFTAGQTIANAVIVPVGSDGKIRILNGAWLPTDVVVDVVGYYSPYAMGAYMPMAPQRWLDTRDPATWSGGQLNGRNYIWMQVTNRGGISAVVLNTTVTNTADQGHLTVSGDSNTLAAYQNGTANWPGLPNVSTLNWVAGQTVPNLAMATPGGDGIVDFWNESDGNLDLIVDAFGFYQSN